jgi:hypothetical protein
MKADYCRGEGAFAPTDYLDPPIRGLILEPFIVIIIPIILRGNTAGIVAIVVAI